jgi:redox-sensitive bicupin YhaK (pirin superfamily)
MIHPKYRDVKKAEIPLVTLDDGTVIKVICGTVQGTGGPVHDIVIDPAYLDVSVPGGSTFVHETKRGHTVFAYVIAGRGTFGPEGDVKGSPKEKDSEAAVNRLVGPETLVLFGEGDAVNVSATDKGLRFLFISGNPLEEPVAWHGPIVMNTEEELRTAFEEYDEGTFIKES